MKREFSKVLNEALAYPGCYNFHSHTQFCDARATMEEIAAAAFNCGMRWYGFTPHSPVCVPTPCNMRAEDVKLYIDEMERLKGMYDGRMNLYAGMEVDYISPEWGPHTEYFQNLPLDFLIGSIHFIPNRKGEYIDVDGKPESFARKLNEDFDNDLHYIVETFFSQTAEMIERGGFDILGHFDKITRNAEYVSPGISNEEWFMALADDISDKVIERGVAVEINTKAYADTGIFFPAPRHWRALSEAGIMMPINSDTHYPDKIQSSRMDAYMMLQKITAP